MSILYNSSKGPIPIDGMVLSYAKNALNKLRTDENKHRTVEIAALEVHIDKLLHDGGGIGHNGAPQDERDEPAQPMDYAALVAHMEDLLAEAGNFADGVALTSQGQADAVGFLREQLKKAEKLADEARTAEKAPHDKAVKEIQDRYNAWIAPLKNKTAGRIPKANLALGNLINAFLDEQKAAQRAEAERLAKQADEAHQAALAARAQIESSTDIAAIDEAEKLIEQADALQSDFDRVAKAKVQVKGEGQERAITQRTRWIATRIEGEGSKALSHYARTKTDEVLAFLQGLADRDVKDGVRNIPGFTVTSETYVV